MQTTSGAGMPRSEGHESAEELKQRGDAAFLAGVVPIGDQSRLRPLCNIILGRVRHTPVLSLAASCTSESGTIPYRFAVLLHTGDIASAAAAFTTGLGCTPQSDALRKTLAANLSVAHEQAGDFAAALQAADAAVAAAPRWAKAHLRLCAVLTRCCFATAPCIGVANMAACSLSTVWSRFRVQISQLSFPKRRRGRALIGLKRFTAAAEALEQSLTLSPGDAGILQVSYRAQSIPALQSAVSDASISPCSPRPPRLRRRRWASLESWQLSGHRRCQYPLQPPNGRAATAARPAVTAPRRLRQWVQQRSRRRLLRKAAAASLAPACALRRSN